MDHQRALSPRFSDRISDRLARVASVVALAMVTLLGAACEDRAGDELEAVRIKGEWFHLERAMDDPSRIQGLSGREFIAEDGGMIFVFPRPGRLWFLMRDCFTPIDIAFLDEGGRVVAIHHMEVEEPRREGESDLEYEERLTKYPSRFPAQFAIETAGGRLRDVGLETGDLIDLDLDRLKRQAK